MSPLAVVITAEQSERLEALCEASGFSPDYQIGAMIDLDFEEWVEPDDANLRDVSRSTRFARFEAAERGVALPAAFDEHDPRHVSITSLDVGFDLRTQSMPVHLPIDVEAVRYTDRNGDVQTVRGSADQIAAVLDGAGYRVVRS